MVEIPTMQDEDAKRPQPASMTASSESESRNRQPNEGSVWFGSAIRGFNPKLKRATTRLDGLPHA